VIKLMELPSKSHSDLFDSEFMTIEAISKIDELKDYTPRYCWAAKTETDDLGILVQRYEPVVTLHQVIAGKRTMDAQTGYDLIVNIIDAFEQLHMAGYIHRDIKPANILIRTGGKNAYVPIIIDFGFACEIPCADRERKGTPGYIPNNWIGNTEGRNRSKPFKRENIYVVRKPGIPVVMPNGKTRQTFDKNLIYESQIPANATRRRKLKTQPYRLYPEYSKHSDNYALAVTLTQLYGKIDWTGHTDMRDRILEAIQRFHNTEVFELAAQFARNSSGFQERRMEAIRALNAKRAARLEDRVGENANAKLLANFADTAANRRGPANNTARRSKRQRTEKKNDD
jgi:serine/threonine protein kinase